MTDIRKAMLDSDEMLVYLHGQIDPHDRLNPTYALLNKQIEAINKARSDLMSMQLPALVITTDEWNRLEREKYQ